MEGWKYDNCDAAAAGNLGRALGADITLQGYAGVGLTQNANSKTTWMLGKKTMTTLYNYTLQTDDSKTPEIFDLKAAHQKAGAERALIISLGGNDYNHQKGHVPSNESFVAAYVAFLDQLLSSYGYAPQAELGSEKADDSGLPAPTLISVCGQGSPIEAKEDPDNNRCRPCPHVEDATKVRRFFLALGMIGIAHPVSDTLAGLQ